MDKPCTCANVTHAGRELADLVSVQTLRQLQERFAALGRVSIWICGADGHLVTEPVWGHDFARLIGESARGRAAVEAHIAALAQDPFAQGRSVCFERAALYVAPIVHRQRRVGAIVVGPRPNGRAEPATVQALARQCDVDPDRLLEAAAAIEPWSNDAQQATYRFADSLADVIALLYGQAIEINNQLADLNTVYSLAEMLAGTHDLQEILDLTTRNVVEALKVKACAIRLLDEDRQELVIKSVCNLSPEYLAKGPVLVGANAIDTAALAGETVYIDDAPNDPRVQYREDARREGIVSGLCAPMTYRGRTVGVIRVYTAERYVFAEAEAALLRAIGSQAATAILHSRMYAQRARAEQVQRQLEVAGQIQRRMLPVRPPAHAAFDCAAVYHPTLELGGDFYDFVELPQGNIGVCIADVMGKGLPAALQMASIRSALRAQASWIYDLDETIVRVNQDLCRDTLVGEFATLFYGVLTPDGRRLTYCNAGHDPPLHLRGERFTELATGGMVIGVNPESRFERGLLTLQHGDVLVLATDGVLNAVDFSGQVYGRERFRASILRHRQLDAQHLAAQLLWDLRRFVGLAEQADDITLVVVKVR
ncbi:MAG TPA: SpoIIE family protein phosphatase [Phycisphaerae bacterium]|nr:SpoIIE family protein phosphatase [Phycisphaerae bacterium]HNU44631.1 SpoIIE family protein phosphatase [Phycisphaerae bacterium]